MSAPSAPARTVEGRSVRLRPLAAGDEGPIFDWYSDPERVAPFDHYDADTYESFIAELAAAPEDPASLAPRFVVERIEGARRIGVVGYYRSHPVLTLTDLWYLIGEPTERGHGYGREAVELLIGHLFASGPLVRVGATCDVENLASARLLERLGFSLEGTLASALFHHGRFHDVRLYGLTRAAWDARRA